MKGFKLDEGRLIDFFNGKFSEKDEEYVNSIFADETKKQELKRILSKQFDELLPEDEIEEKNLDHILYRINYEINSKRESQKAVLFDIVLKWGLRIASLIVLPVLIYSGISTMRESALKKETWVEIKAPAWTRAQFTLPDGTVGWLNSNSSVKYSGNFNLDRQVTLNGEAFFDVFKDKSRPFVVNTNEVFVKVLGTRFNIASYANEKDVEVVLEDGSLVFNIKNIHKLCTMVPNDLITYDKTKQDFSKETVQTQKYLSWTEGRLEFRNDPLDVISRRLERWYNIDIELNVNLKDDPRLRATFVNEGFEEVLDLLRRSLPVDYKVEKGKLLPDGTYAKTKVKIFSKTN
jgi:ferric-dicitrate binding protein FerR (iron transport regulator)